MLMIVVLASYASWPSVPVVTYQNTIVAGVIKTVHLCVILFCLTADADDTTKKCLG